MNSLSPWQWILTKETVKRLRNTLHSSQTSQITLALSIALKWAQQVTSAQGTSRLSTPCTPSWGRTWRSPPSSPTSTHWRGMAATSCGSPGRTRSLPPLPSLSHTYSDSQIYVLPSGNINMSMSMASADFCFIHLSCCLLSRRPCSWRWHWIAFPGWRRPHWLGKKSETVSFPLVARWSVGC